MINDIPHCDTRHTHAQKCDDAVRSMPDEDKLYDVADLFKMFCDSTRVKILYSLIGREMCVCDIAASLGMTLSAISHQLRVLKSARLVKFRRDGKTVWYSLDDDHVTTILDMGLEHISER
ncbi:MAG: metalloregulator ArsR/SmtB family transcription factor [Clostridia bacterium]|nr:metalloregulator ArsR/SmtB family transcription factor [Clostridia bacterium]